MKTALAAERPRRHRKPGPAAQSPSGLDAGDRTDAPMRYRRQHPRTTETPDLAATVWRSRRRCVVGRVLNLSETGLLVVGDGVAVGDVTAFELRGSDFCFGGYAEVAHVTRRAMGLHVLGWRGPASRRIDALMLRRVKGNDRYASQSAVPAEFLG
jgi:hypothetical protein